MAKKVIGLVAIAILLIAIVAVWHWLHPPQSPLVTPNGKGDTTSTQNVGDFDQFQQDLAARVLKQFAGGSDFTVIVATTAYPLGTLLRPTGSIPADLEDCVPAVPPKPFAAQHLFPSYSMSSATALAANLGSGALQGLDSAGVDLKQSQNLQYTIADAQIQIMDDKSVEQVAGQSNCGAYISAHRGMRMIRGTVLGKMTFTVKVDNPASVKAQLAKLGGFTINDNPGSSTVSIADNDPQPIVQLLSEFGSSPAGSVSHPIPKPVQAAPAPTQSPISRAPGSPHIYVQADALDSPASGQKVVQLLRTDWPSANIEAKVQRIPNQKMPDTAQVRYFGESDVALANRCVTILRKVYPDARLVRIGLASPIGQLEVWLPKVKSSSGG